MKFFYAPGAVVCAARRFKLASVLSLIVFTLTFSSLVSAAELVVNGGFEQPVVDPALRWMTLYGENQPLGEPGDCPQDQTAPDWVHCNEDMRVPGWSVYWTDDLLNNRQVTPGRLEIQYGTIDGIGACDGTLQKAELDSHHRQGSDNNNVTIAQFLPTCPLTGYTLTYGWKSRTQDPLDPRDNDVRVVINDKVVAFHDQNDDWKMEKIRFFSDGSDETLLLFGSIGTETTLGMYIDEVSVTGPDGDEEPCTRVCDDKPMELTLLYDGDDDTNHRQTGKEVIIYPEVVPSYPENAVIKVYGHNVKKPQLLGTFNVAKNGLFTVVGPRKRIPPRMVFEIYHSNNLENPFQTIMFHTSCSQPMEAGDEFGAITIWSAVN